MFMFEIIFIILVGTLLHFTYEWSNHNRIVGWFSAVNESTWEHIKIFLFPAFLTILFDVWTYGENLNYWFAKLAMMLFFCIVMPLVFYGVKAINKKAILSVDVAIFVLVTIYSVLLFQNMLGLKDLGLEVLGIIGLVIIFIAFALLTYLAPKWFLFEDPRNKKQGIEAHICGHSHKK